MKGKLLVLLVSVLILFTIGCTDVKKFDPLMNDAKNAIEEAKKVDAEEHSPETLKQAQEAYDTAVDLCEKKKVKEIELYANKAIELANQAKNEALVVKKEAERVIQVKEDYNTDLEDLMASVDNIKMVPDEHQKTKDLIEQAKAEFESGEYDKALETLSLANETLKKGKEIQENFPVSYKVVKGDCLWDIAKKKNIYGDPFKWPTIYRANRDKIRDPDLIYPNQVFTIPRP